MHYKRIKKDGKILVLSVRKTISISLLWSRYMWLVLIAGLLPVGGGGIECVCVCVLLYAAVFVFVLVSRLGIRVESRVRVNSVKLL